MTESFPVLNTPFGGVSRHMNTSLSVQKMEQRYDTIHVMRAKFIIVPLPFEELHLLPLGVS